MLDPHHIFLVPSNRKRSFRLCGCVIHPYGHDYASWPSDLPHAGVSRGTPQAVGIRWINQPRKRWTGSCGILPHKMPKHLARNWGKIGAPIVWQRPSQPPLESGRLYRPRGLVVHYFRIFLAISLDLSGPARKRFSK